MRRIVIDHGDWFRTPFFPSTSRTGQHHYSFRTSWTPCHKWLRCGSSAYF